MSSIAGLNHDLYIAIDACRKMPVLSQDAYPLGIWWCNLVSSLLQPLVPLAVSVAAVPREQVVFNCKHTIHARHPGQAWDRVWRAFVCESTVAEELALVRTRFDESDKWRTKFD